ncbi:MAG: hypothetical protein ABNH38_17630 [Tateyamaria sp.]|jgi:hypothetical protein|uniref:hypothetical protein n=1 Tax=Tateyamaria sp. TaxID=1929288 RepID=UPI0032DDAD57
MKLNVLPDSGGVIAVDHLGFDPFEAGVLAVTRHFMTSFDAPNLQAWQAGFKIAVERWGENIGLSAAYSVLKLVKALRDVRSDFDYHDPLCTDARVWATADEAQLMRMLHHMRRDQTNDARDALDVLTKGRMDPQVIRAGLTLAARFGAGVPRRGPRPAFHVVN